MAQRVLRETVPPLGARLARVRPAVELEVQLADQRGKLLRLGACTLEELARGAQLHARGALDVAQAVGELDHERRLAIAGPAR